MMTNVLVHALAAQQNVEGDRHPRLRSGILQLNVQPLGRLVTMDPRRKFKLEGDRAGFARFREGDAQGSLEWEMLVGEIDMVIYPGSCWWMLPREARMQPDEVRRLAQELANEMRINIDVAFHDGSEILRPAAVAT
jgi:hypothetical protein